jgi:YVTN family beta-propeller protein
VAYITETLSNSIAQLDLTKDTVSRFISAGNDVCGIVLNSTGTVAYVANQFSDNIGIVDLTTNRQIGTIPLTGDPLPVAISTTDSVLFVTTNANRLFKIDLATNAITGFLDLPATSHHLLRHPNGNFLYVATRDAGSVLEVDWRTMTVLRTFKLGGRPQGMGLSASQIELYVANETSNVMQIIWLPTGSIDAVRLAGGGEGLAVNRDGMVYVGLVFNGLVQVVDPAASTVVRTITVGGTPRELVIDASRNRVLVTNENGWVDLIRVH